MFGNRKNLSTAIRVAAVAGAVLLSAGPAGAVVYCKAVGTPVGCVARPGGAVVHPVVPHRHVVYCTRVGVPKGCVMR